MSQDMQGFSTETHMVIGTLVTGFYVIRMGEPTRLSPVFRSRSSAQAWLRAR